MCNNGLTAMENTLQTNWKDFFGSSVSLAPSLLSIYDHVTSSGHPDHVTSCVDSTDCGGLVVFSDIDCSDADKSSSSSSSRCNCISSLHLSHTTRPSVTAASSCQGLHTPTLTTTTTLASTHTHHVPPTNNILATPSFCITTSASGAASDVTMYRPEADVKKRPLSIRSTSSTASSTSGTVNIRRRKKMATGSGNESTELATLCERGAGGSGAGVVEERYSESDSSGTTTSVELSTGTDSRPRSLQLTDDDCDYDNNAVAATTTSNNSTYIQRVITELTDTERAYVSDLRDVIQGYMACCINNINTTTTTNSNLSLRDVETIFGNIRDIYSFNSEFLSELQCCQQQPTSVASVASVAGCFVRHSRGFGVYSDYCTNYSRSVSVLTRCLQDPVAAQLFSRQQMALQHDLPLGAYLLKPVQRIFKYQLLLQNMLNQCNGESSERQLIQTALELMVNVTLNINELKREHDRTMRTIELHSSLNGWMNTDITTLGQLILEDKFKLFGAKTFRHLFLFEKGLIIAKRKEDGMLQVKATIMCCNLMLVETISKAPLNFHLVPFDNPRIQFTIQARTLEQKRLWCREVKKAILDNYQAIIPDKAKQLVMTLGTEITKEEQEQLVSNGQLRKVQHKSSGFISDLSILKPRKGLHRSESAGSSVRDSVVDRATTTLYSKQNSANNYKHSADDLKQTHSTSDSKLLMTSSMTSPALTSLLTSQSSADAVTSPSGGVAPTAIAEIISDDDELEQHADESWSEALLAGIPAMGVTTTEIPITEIPATGADKTILESTLLEETECNETCSVEQSEESCSTVVSLDSRNIVDIKRYCTCDITIRPAINPLQSTGPLQTTLQSTGPPQTTLQTTTAMRSTVTLLNRRLVNPPTDFRRYRNTTSMLASRPIRSASVDRHIDNNGLVFKYTPHTNRNVTQTLSSVSSHTMWSKDRLVFANRTAYRVSTLPDHAVHPEVSVDRRISRLCTPPRDLGPPLIVREIQMSCVPEQEQEKRSVPPRAQQESDSDGEVVTETNKQGLRYCGKPDRKLGTNGLVRRAGSSDILSSTGRSRDNDIMTRSETVNNLLVRRSSIQDQTRSLSRAKRAGSYHGTVHHSTVGGINVQPAACAKSPVDSIRTVIRSFTGRLAGRRATTPQTQDSVCGPADTQQQQQQQQTGGLVSRLRASYRLTKKRSQSTDRQLSTSLQETLVDSTQNTDSHQQTNSNHQYSVTSANDVTTSRDESVTSQTPVSTQHYVPFIDDSENEE